MAAAKKSPEEVAGQRGYSRPLNFSSKRLLFVSSCRVVDLTVLSECLFQASHRPDRPLEHHKPSELAALHQIAFTTAERSAWLFYHARHQEQSVIGSMCGPSVRDTTQPQRAMRHQRARLPSYYAKRVLCQLCRTFRRAASLQSSECSKKRSM